MCITLHHLLYLHVKMPPVNTLYIQIAHHSFSLLSKQTKQALWVNDPLTEAFKMATRDTDPAIAMLERHPILKQAR